MQHLPLNRENRGLIVTRTHRLSFPGSSDDKEAACNAGGLGSIPGSGRSPGEGNGNPLRYSCLGNPWEIQQSMGFSRQEYWSGLPFPSPGDLPDPGIEPKPPAFQADALTSEPPGIFSSFSSCFRCKVRLFT